MTAIVSDPFIALNGHGVLLAQGVSLFVLSPYSGDLIRIDREVRDVGPEGYAVVSKRHLDRLEGLVREVRGREKAKGEGIV